MRIERFGNRFWAVYDGGVLVCVTVYLKGAEEVVRRLSALYAGIAALTAQGRGVRS